MGSLIRGKKKNLELMGTQIYLLQIETETRTRKKSVRKGVASAARLPPSGAVWKRSLGERYFNPQITGLRFRLRALSSICKSGCNLKLCAFVFPCSNSRAMRLSGGSEDGGTECRPGPGAGLCPPTLPGGSPSAQHSHKSQLKVTHAGA